MCECSQTAEPLQGSICSLNFLFSCCSLSREVRSLSGSFSLTRSLLKLHQLGFDFHPLHYQRCFLCCSAVAGLWGRISWGISDSGSARGAVRANQSVPEQPPGLGKCCINLLSGVGRRVKTATCVATCSSLVAVIFLCSRLAL